MSLLFYNIYFLLIKQICSNFLFLWFLMFGFSCTTGFVVQTQYNRKNDPSSSLQVESAQSLLSTLSNAALFTDLIIIFKPR